MIANSTIAVEAKTDPIAIQVFFDIPCSRNLIDSIENEYLEKVPIVFYALWLFL